jgi:hypothetical protein
MGNYISFYESEKESKKIEQKNNIRELKESKINIKDMITSEEVELDSDHYYQLLENNIINKYGINYDIQNKFIWREKLGNHVELIFGKVDLLYNNDEFSERLIILKQKNFYYKFEFDSMMEFNFTKLFFIKINKDGINLIHKNFEPIIIDKSELRNKFRRKRYLISSIKNGISYIC